MSELASRVRPPLAFVRLAVPGPGRPLLPLGIAALFICLFAPAAGAQPEKPINRLRSPDRVIVRLLEEGCRRSPSFKRLCDQVQHSDLIVYFEPSRDIPRSMQAYLQLAGATPKVRIIRVALKIPANTDALISRIGHELEHATEIARATEVRDQAAMEALYRRIGDENEAGWDTLAARQAGAAVLDELRNNDGRTLKAATRPASPPNASAAAGSPPK